MCLGIPMQVVHRREGRAQCRNGDELEWVDMSLLEDQPVGRWVLVFLGAAREVLDEQRAGQISNALAAVQAVMQGRSIDLDQQFADLVEREPQLPPHLKHRLATAPDPVSANDLFTTSDLETDPQKTGA